MLCNSCYIMKPPVARCILMSRGEILSLHASTTLYNLPNPGNLHDPWHSLQPTCSQMHTSCPAAKYSYWMLLQITPKKCLHIFKKNHPFLASHYINNATFPPQKMNFWEMTCIAANPPDKWRHSAGICANASPKFLTSSCSSSSSSSWFHRCFHQILQQSKNNTS